MAYVYRGSALQKLGDLKGGSARLQRRHCLRRTPGFTLLLPQRGLPEPGRPGTSDRRSRDRQCPPRRPGGSSYSVVSPAAVESTPAADKPEWHQRNHQVAPGVPLVSDFSSGIGILPVPAKQARRLPYKACGKLDGSACWTLHKNQITLVIQQQFRKSL